MVDISELKQNIRTYAGSLVSKLELLWMVLII